MNRADNFNRTTTPPSMGTPSDSGSGWTTLSGSYGCGHDGTSGRDVAFCHSQGSITLDCGATDHAGSAVMVNRNDQAGIIVRAADDSNYYLFNVQPDGTSQLYKKVSGSFTQLASGSGTVVAGDTIFLQVVGSALTAQVNGGTVATATDSDLTTGTFCGLRSGGSDAVFYDDFAITDLSGGGGGSVHPWWQYAGPMMGVLAGGW